ncbi:hypothetical protein B5E53_15605 [Eubacterium sp. An11]|uniref:hypothetical protein n=1 Tax=Eubacterium sp. An11 TaxID=1965542 RepID=UPI000B388FC2|nr:hypothetical protein [Eubacterium sp. An11]OUQ63686.1 hypothetical protein B5E53_15605 [Eubacterium sp. An11]
MLVSVIALQMLAGPATWGETFEGLPILLYKRVLRFVKKIFLNYEQQLIVVISMRYLLPNDWFLMFKKELIKVIEHYIKKTSCFTEKEVLKFMGFPENWKDITQYRKT